MNEPRRVIAYVRVSTQEQSVEGVGLDVQRSTIQREAEHRGWDLVDVVADEGESGKHLDRPGVQTVLARLAAEEADTLVVAKLDRLSRSLIDVAELLDWTGRLDVALIALDLGIDTSKSAGKLMAHLLAVVAQWEREQIADRTRDAASERRRQGKPISRPSVRDTMPHVADRIGAEREAGSTWQKIADGLNDDSVPTVRGGTKWRVSSVQSAAGYVRPAARPKRVALPEPARRRGNGSGGRTGRTSAPEAAA